MSHLEETQTAEDGYILVSDPMAAAVDVGVPDYQELELFAL
jgi:hypothetical protein